MLQIKESVETCSLPADLKLELLTVFAFILSAAHSLMFEGLWLKIKYKTEFNLSLRTNLI